MTPQEIFAAHQRQVHLDFHTSPRIPGIGSEFDATEFADTIARARINSVTVFAKCHHGMCYYPTATGSVHPGLAKGRDLLGEQIEALHRRGIRAPIYTTVVWEEDVAARFPQWRQMTRSGHFAAWGADGSTAGGIGSWKFLNFLDPDYQDYIEAHVNEILARYGREVDGLFFDIVFFAPNACWSEASQKFRKRHGLVGEDADTYARFQGLAQRAFAAKFTRIVKGRAPQATVFYNASNDANTHPEVGPRARAASQTHNEIESLPSGAWGYYHFPRMARFQSSWGKPWLGMTGRFQKMWGDFGGIKPQAALEFECFRAQALGGANSVGDQLPPRGRLDPAAYTLIGSVFSQCEAAEPFYAGSEFVPVRTGIVTPCHGGRDGGKSEEGAVQMCEETHHDCSVLDSASDLRGHDLLILPDSTVVDAALAKRLEAFHRAGGKLIVSHKAGCDADGKWALGFLPLSFHGEVDKFPTYWRARRDFDASLADSDRVFYEAGLLAKPGKGARVLVDRVLPYFRRSAHAYSSHFQTPPVAKPCAWPAVIAGERFVYFADPIFREYRQAGNLTARDVLRRAIALLRGPAEFGEGLPTTVLVYPRKQDEKLLLTLLHYIPVRKSLDIDIIEERMSFAGETLRLAGADASTRVLAWPSGEELRRSSDGGFELPSVKGRLLLEVPGWFERRPSKARRRTAQT